MPVEFNRRLVNSSDKIPVQLGIGTEKTVFKIHELQDGEEKAIGIYHEKMSEGKLNATFHQQKILNCLFPNVFPPIFDAKNNTLTGKPEIIMPVLNLETKPFDGIPYIKAVKNTEFFQNLKPMLQKIGITENKMLNEIALNIQISVDKEGEKKPICADVISPLMKIDIKGSKGYKGYIEEPCLNRNGVMELAESLIKEGRTDIDKDEINKNLDEYYKGIQRYFMYKD